jgi:hypothetical protein
LEYPVAVYNGIAFTQEGHSIVGFNTQNGALIWNFTNADLWPVSEQVFADGFLYAGFSDGQLYAIRAPTSGIQAGNLNLTLLDEGQNIYLLLTIVALLALALATILLLYRNRQSQKQEQFQAKINVAKKHGRAPEEATSATTACNT